MEQPSESPAETIAPAEDPPPPPGTAPTGPQSSAQDHSTSESLGDSSAVRRPPPPLSPLTGGYLLIVVGEPHSERHKEIILQKIAKAFLSWDVNECHVSLEKELEAITGQSPSGEEARYGERLIQYATENLVTEILIHPQLNTLHQCMKNLLSSFTKHRHIIHAGYTFAGNGSWILQDGTLSISDLIEALHEPEVLRVLKAYENSVSIDVHCAAEGDWSTERFQREPVTKLCTVRVNPGDVMTAGNAEISAFIEYLSPFLEPANIQQLLQPTDVVGNIRFTHPTLYVFPGGQGDAALFGINGFNMLIDGGFARKACFWDFARHLDRLDAVLLTRLNNSTVNGISAVLQRKKMNHVYPQIGHFFCNLQDRKIALSPDGDKDKDSLIVNLAEEGHEIVANLRHLALKPHPCYRDGNQIDPVNLYHKVGHGKLDMYVISPARDSQAVKEFLAKWTTNDSQLFSNTGKKVGGKTFEFPLQNLVSICALLVWQPANPNDTITRILFPGSTPQHKIFEGLEKLRHLEFLKHPVCSASSLGPSAGATTTSRSASKTRASRIVESRPAESKGLNKGQARQIRSRSEKTPSRETKSKVDMNKLLDEKKDETVLNESIKKLENRILSKDEQIENIKKEIHKMEAGENEEQKKKVVHRSKYDMRHVKSKVDSRAPSKSVDRKKVVEKKGEGDTSPPTTPKNAITNGTATKKEKFKVGLTKSGKSSSSPSSTPAKSAKEANNRKVVEARLTRSSSKSLTRKKEETQPPSSGLPAAVKADRKLIGRRPKGPPSPVNKGGGAPTKISKGDAEAAKKVPKKPDAEETFAKAVGVAGIGAQDETEKTEAEKKTTEELEENKSGEPENPERKETDLLAVKEEVAPIQSQDLEKSQDEPKEREDEEEGGEEEEEEEEEVEEEEEEEEEYLIITKEESGEEREEDVEENVKDNGSAQEEPQTKDETEGEGEIKKLLREEVESEKKQKPTTDGGEEEGDDHREKHQEENHSEGRKEENEESNELLDANSKDREEKPEPKNVGDHQDEAAASLIDAKSEPELKRVDEKIDQKDGAGVKEHKEGESFPEEKLSHNTLETSATTAPTLPEDEKVEEGSAAGDEENKVRPDEVVEEKYIQEETKEDKQKESDDSEARRPVIPEIAGAEGSAWGSQPVVRKPREVVKTPDEVADLPMHEEVDPIMYSSGDFTKEFQKKPSQENLIDERIPEEETAQNALELTQNKGEDFDLPPELNLSDQADVENANRGKPKGIPETVAEKPEGKQTEDTVTVKEEDGATEIDVSSEIKIKHDDEVKDGRKSEDEAEKVRVEDDVQTGETKKEGDDRVKEQKDRKDELEKEEEGVHAEQGEPFRTVPKEASKGEPELETDNAEAGSRDSKDQPEETDKEKQSLSEAEHLVKEGDEEIKEEKDEKRDTENVADDSIASKYLHIIDELEKSESSYVHEKGQKDKVKDDGNEEAESSGKGLEQVVSEGTPEEIESPEKEKEKNSKAEPEQEKDVAEEKVPMKREDSPKTAPSSRSPEGKSDHEDGDTKNDPQKATFSSLEAGTKDGSDGLSEASAIDENDGPTSGKTSRRPSGKVSGKSSPTSADGASPVDTEKRHSGKSTPAEQEKVFHEKDLLLGDQNASEIGAPIEMVRESPSCGKSTPQAQETSRKSSLIDAEKSPTPKSFDNESNADILQRTDEKSVSEESRLEEAVGKVTDSLHENEMEGLEADESEMAKLEGTQEPELETPGWSAPNESSDKEHIPEPEKISPEKQETETKTLSLRVSPSEMKSERELSRKSSAASVASDLGRCPSAEPEKPLSGKSSPTNKEKIGSGEGISVGEDETAASRIGSSLKTLPTSGKSSPQDSTATLHETTATDLAEDPKDRSRKSSFHDPEELVSGKSTLLDSASNENAFLSAERASSLMGDSEKTSASETHEQGDSTKTIPGASEKSSCFPADESRVTETQRAMDGDRSRAGSSPPLSGPVSSHVSAESESILKCVSPQEPATGLPEEEVVVIGEEDEPRTAEDKSLPAETSQQSPAKETTEQAEITSPHATEPFRQRTASAAETSVLKGTCDDDGDDTERKPSSRTPTPPCDASVVLIHQEELFKHEPVSSKDDFSCAEGIKVPGREKGASESVCSGPLWKGGSDKTSPESSEKASPPASGKPTEESLSMALAEKGTSASCSIGKEGLAKSSSPSPVDISPLSLDEIQDTKGSSLDKDTKEETSERQTPKITGEILAKTPVQKLKYEDGDSSRTSSPDRSHGEKFDLSIPNGIESEEEIEKGILENEQREKESQILDVSSDEEEELKRLGVEDEEEEDDETGMNVERKRSSLCASKDKEEFSEGTDRPEGTSRVADVGKEEKDDLNQLMKTGVREIDQDDDPKTEVKRMLVTASSEDGGTETEICIQGGVKTLKEILTENQEAQEQSNEEEFSNLILEARKEYNAQRSRKTSCNSPAEDAEEAGDDGSVESEVGSEREELGSLLMQARQELAFVRSRSREMDDKREPEVTVSRSTTSTVTTITTEKEKQEDGSFKITTRKETKTMMGGKDDGTVVTVNTTVYVSEKEAAAAEKEEENTLLLPRAESPVCSSGKEEGTGSEERSHVSGEGGSRRTSTSSVISQEDLICRKDSGKMEDVRRGSTEMSPLKTTYITSRGDSESLMTSSFYGNLPVEEELKAEYVRSFRKGRGYESVTEIGPNGEKTERTYFYGAEEDPERTAREKARFAKTSHTEEAPSSMDRAGHVFHAVATVPEEQSPHEVTVQRIYADKIVEEDEDEPDKLRLVHATFPTDTNLEQGNNDHLATREEPFVKTLEQGVTQASSKEAPKEHEEKESSVGSRPEEGEDGSKRDVIEGWGKPLGLPFPQKNLTKNYEFRGQNISTTSSLSTPSDNSDSISNWGQPMSLPSPAPPVNQNSVPEGVPPKMATGVKETPRKEKFQTKKGEGKSSGANTPNRRSQSPAKQAEKRTPSANRTGKSNSNSYIYLDLTYVPHHGNSYYINVEFFKKVRARYYVFSGTEPSKEVYNALLEAKQTWEDKNLEVTIIPTYDTDILGYWVAENEEVLAKHKIDLSPSASRCTINLQDHETSCSAYRLEF